MQRIFQHPPLFFCEAFIFRMNQRHPQRPEQAHTQTTRRQWLTSGFLRPLYRIFKRCTPTPPYFLPARNHGAIGFLYNPNLQDETTDRMPLAYLHLVEVLLGLGLG